YRDADTDTYGTTSLTENTCIGSPSTGYVADSTDCDDGDIAVNPGATEACNGIDDDCAGGVDDGLLLATFYADSDSDTYGNAAVATSACSAPGGYVTDDTDCDDTDGAVNPGATEVCNGIDDDCIGGVDDGLATSTFYADSDGDSYGDSTVSTSACAAPQDYVVDDTDCDDLLASVYPGAIEICGDGIDQDCSGADLTCTGTDNDGDGFSAVQGDCDDSDANIFPGAPEVCDGDDNDCDGFYDEDPPTLYADTDGDGFGSAGATTLACGATGYVPFAGDCDDGDPAFNPLADEVCGDALDQDCTGADLACPSYPLMASTIVPLQQGDWWSYAVTGVDTGTLTKNIAIGLETSPESSEDCLALVNGFDLTVTGVVTSLAYLAQDPDGTIRVCGSWDSGVSPDWVAAKDGGSYDIYPSPLSVGQFGGSAFSFDTEGSEGAYTYTVDSIESVQTPAGIFSTYKIWTTYYEFWPGATTAEDEEFFEYNVSWFAPDYGEVMFNTQFFNFIGTSLTPEYNVYLEESLTDSNRLSTGCGDVGSGSGQLSALAGTWIGTGNDDFISVGGWLDYEVSVTMNGSGNVTEILLNSSDASVTGIATAVDDNLYTVEFNDASTGQLLVDNTFNYMVFMRNIGFATGDMFFSVLQKGAAGVPATYPKYLPVGSYSGIGYDICPINQEYYRFGATQISVEPEDLFLMPVTGVGPNGFFTGRFGVYSPTHGWWNGYDDDGGDLHMFLSPDGQFAGVYHQVRGGFYVWPSEFAFYALSR
ncbi:putative metal-binding motif-containing protein, partial [bacterium]|nr:putative metal-binding motif-containing protein [bacterium]